MIHPDDDLCSLTAGLKEFLMSLHDGLSNPAQRRDGLFLCIPFARDDQSLPIDQSANATPIAKRGRMSKND